MNQAISSNDSVQMTLPLIQPLRYWTHRPVVDAVVVRPANKRLPAISASRGFTMKGGFVQCVDGVRRMVIAGHIVKNEMAKV